VIAIDTNVLLRYLLRDDELQARKASKIITGSNLVYVSQVVLAETVWTLTGKKYNVTPNDVHAALVALFSEENIVIQDAEVVWRAVVDYRQYRVEKNKKVDFSDALIFHTGKNAAGQYSETFDGFYTFDVAARSLPGAIAP